MTNKIHKCKYCGCTEYCACQGGCFWINTKKTLCSSCYEIHNKKCANIIWDNAFRDGLYKLKKDDLINIVNLLAQKINIIKDPNQDMFWKDVAFNEKCEIILALDEKFFDD